MENQVSQQIVEYLQNRENLASSNIPEIVQQVLQYEKISSIVSTIVAFICIVVAGYIIYRTWKYPSLDSYGSREIGSVLGLIIPAIILPCLLGTLYCSIISLIKLQVAPKYFLIQLLSKLNEQ